MLIYPTISEEESKIDIFTVKDNDLATDTLPRPHRTTNDDNNDQQQQIFRIKGILSIQHGPDDDDNSNDDDDKEEDRWTHPGTRIDRRRFIVQAVHDLWDIYPASGGPDAVWDDKDPRTSQLVVIGRHLQGAALQRAFEACRMAVPADKWRGSIVYTDVKDSLEYESSTATTTIVLNCITNCK